MSDLCENVQAFLKNFSLDNSKLTYLVGFSGGFDSMCLLHCLKQISENRIVAIHLNHNWRGIESDLEEENCRKFCAEKGIEFYSEKLDENISHTETAARNARYKFFEKCAKKFNSKIIFTAHNKNDNAETIIYRICHGTGVSGLQGILPRRGIFYRPLLQTERKDIEKYCHDNNLNPNFDTSNDDMVHKRNLIRHEILPKMAEINPNIINSLVSLAQIAQEETQIIKDCTNIVNDGKINTKDFILMSEALQKRILYEIITPIVPQDYDKERILTLWRFIKDNHSSKSGKKISVTTDCWLFVNDKIIELIWKNIEATKTKISINSTGNYEQDGVCVEFFEYNNETNFSDCTILADLSGIKFEFTLRNRMDGDIIQPYGMMGTQKLKKYLNERKIPNHEKDKLLFLAQGNEILWAVGIGISDKIKVRKNPTHVITVKRRENEIR